MINFTILFKYPRKEASLAGFTLIELIMSMVVLSFVLSSLVKLYSDLAMISVQPEYRSTQTMLAQELLEEVRSKQFDELMDKDASGNWSWTVGPNADEAAGNKSTFDDADDFDGWEEDLAAPFAGFSTSVTVGYVNSADLNTILAIPGTVEPNWTPDYKKVEITVSHSAVEDVIMSTIVSTAKSRDKMY